MRGFGRSFEKGEVEFHSKCLAFAVIYLSLRVRITIAFVSKEDKVYTLHVAVRHYIVHPHLHIGEAPSGRNVIHDHGAVSATIVLSRNGTKSSSPSWIPDLQMDLVIVNLDIFANEINSHRRHKIIVRIQRSIIAGKGVATTLVKPVCEACLPNLAISQHEKVHYIASPLRSHGRIFAVATLHLHDCMHPRSFVSGGCSPESVGPALETGRTSRHAGHTA